MIRNAELRAARGEDFEAIKEILTICGLPPENACDPTSLHHVVTIASRPEEAKAEVDRPLVAGLSRRIIGLPCITGPSVASA